MARILVVDDDQATLLLLLDVLRIDGHDVIGASGADQALQLYQEGAIDLILTDIFMPEKSGIEFVRELLAEYPGARIIALGAGGDEILKIATEAGVCETLAKPFAREELLRTVRRALAKS